MSKFYSINPANNEIIWQGTTASAMDVEHAITKARKVLKKWQFTSLEHRINYLKKVINNFENQREIIAETISKEMGKPLWESLQEVNAMIAKLDISIAAYNERCANKSVEQKTSHSQLMHKPHGVLAVFGPFNFPGHLPNGHILPALLAGNTVVFKPSELTPKVGELLYNCYIESGIPEGVVNIVQGAKQTGVALAHAYDIDGVLFTGSYETGNILNKYFSTYPGKILALEMGGNNPLIVWDVADVKSAAYHIIQSAFITSGQRCTCARRLIIPDNNIGDKVISAVLTWVEQIRIGSYEQKPEPFMGPVINNAQVNNILNSQQKLLDCGASSILEAQRSNNKGAFISPGIIDVTNIAKIEDKEIFGPLLQLYRVQDFASAIICANQTQYGLAAGLIADDVSLFNAFQQNIRAGLINFNTSITGASSKLPFGGIGKSGNFRPGAYYAADYCAYPVASMQKQKIEIPATLTPGLNK